MLQYQDIYGFVVSLNAGTCTSVTAGAVVGPLVVALLAGVVTEVALPPHGVAPLLTVDVAASIIKNPAGAGRQVLNEH